MKYGFFFLCGWLFLVHSAWAQPAVTMPDSAAVVSAYEKGKAALLRKDSSMATRLLLNARDRANKLGLHYLEADIAKTAGDMFYAYETYHRAFANYTTAKNIYIEHPHEVKNAEITFALARTQYYRGNYRLAVNNFTEFLSMARTLNNKQSEAEALEYLGLLYNSFQGFNEGTRYYKRALQIKDNLGDRKGVVRMAQILGETYYRKRQFDSAVYFSGMAHKEAEALHLPTEAYMARLNMAMAEMRRKNWKEAEDMLKPMENTITGNQDENRQLRYQIAMGNLFLSQGDTARAKPYYEAALNKARNSSFPEMYALIYRNMSESYFEIRDYRKAYEYFQKNSDYVAQLYSGRNLANLGSLEHIMNASTSKDEVRVLNVANERKQHQLLKEQFIRQGLEKENALMDDLFAKEKSLSEALERERQSLERENVYKTKQLQNEQQLRAAQSSTLQKERNLRLALVGGLGIALLSGIVIFSLFRRQRRKNKIIQKQSDELQVLMKEIHHRVKNNLQIISSLLDLQSLSIKDKEASEAIKESKNRVQSMALIHQNLYGEGNIKSIRVKEYIDNLVSALCSSYDINDEKVKITTDIDDLTLDIDTMIPLGLVLNELVSNALKYAFRDHETGALHIALKKKGEDLQLKVNDNGAGFPEGLDPHTGKSFGLKMIRAFAQKLKARLHIYNQQGACIEMHITKYKAA
jgi:two-component system, sensor histidine kinase PdtaS